MTYASTSFRYSKEQLLDYCVFLMIRGPFERFKASRVSGIKKTSAYRFVDRYCKITPCAFKIMGINQIQFDNILRTEGHKYEIKFAQILREDE